MWLLDWKRFTEWGGGALDKRPHLINWKVVCTDKSEGRISVKSLSILFFLID